MDKQPKPKREMSDKQKANLQKGLAVLKAKREAKKKNNSVEIELPEDKPAPAPAPAPAAAAEKPESKRIELPLEGQSLQVIKYLTKEDLHEFKNDLLATLYPPQTPVEEAKIKKPRKKTVAIEEPEQVQTYKNVEVKKPAAQKQMLTGYDLLDRLLNM